MMPPRRTEEELLRAAAGALGRIDAAGLRGVTCCSVEEIEAMAVLLARAGLPALPPGLEPEPGAFDLFLTTLKGDRHE
jgi:hypothetical protein